MRRLVGPRGHGNASGQLGFALPERFAQRTRLLKQLGDAGGQRFGIFERHAPGQLLDVGRRAQLDPEMSGSGSYARIDRGGPQGFDLIG